jgi:integrase
MVNGHRITGYGKTVKAARTDLEEKVRRAQGGLPSRDTSITVAGYVPPFVDVVLPEIVRPSTAELYASMLRNHVAPQIGTVRLRDLADHHVLAVAKAMRAKGLANSTVASMVVAAKAMTKAAYRAGLIGTNPLERLAVPSRATEKPQRFLDAAESARLLSALTGDRLEAVWLLAMGTGLRRGELVGLRWSDLAGDRLTVARTVRRVHKVGLVVGETKTQAGRRVVVLPGFVVDALAEHRRRQQVERMAAVVWHDPNVMFASTVGTMLDPRALHRSLAAAAKRAGVEGVHPHALRHSAAAVLLSAGVPLAAVASQLGHGNSAVTARVYEHVLDSAKINNASVLGRYYDVNYDVTPKNTP